MSTIIAESIKEKFSYKEYREYMSALLKQGLSTGHTQNEDLMHYSTLNEVRMNRLDKTIVLLGEAEEALKNLKKEYTLLVISEGWCGDAAQILPVMNKITEATPKLEMEIVLRDDNPQLMDEYLTNGARSIPKLILIEKETNTVRGSWGPRPHGALQLVLDYKEKHGVFDMDAKTALQKWYLEDKGLSTVEEIVLLLKTADSL
ncbi:thioredoxin family protein [Flavobacterium sp. J372]|uniref:thioredoxin family protein n=1 Tax=Flavobacterium sp. J372 TaxID=2898436 RepID=UPI002150743E|nr:thioredoxin family protein [Flavobacterium sp. J372]MCR5861414.1 thioredoxin family protein [Flavobacterium sp. J372]